MYKLKEWKWTLKGTIKQSNSSNKMEKTNNNNHIGNQLLKRNVEKYRQSEGETNILEVVNE